MCVCVGGAISVKKKSCGGLQALKGKPWCGGLQA